MQKKLPPVAGVKKPTTVSADRKPAGRGAGGGGTGNTTSTTHLPKMNKLLSSQSSACVPAPTPVLSTESSAAIPSPLADSVLTVDEPVPAILVVAEDEEQPPPLEQPSPDIALTPAEFSQPVPVPKPQPNLSPEEFGARQERNAEFLVACGKYHKGSSDGDLKRACILFDRGIDVDYVDSDGWSALFYASGEGHLKLVQWLVEDWDATVDLQAPDDCTPLWTASFNGHRDVVSLLLRLGADVAIVGKPVDEPVQSPALAARRNRHPGIGDLIDFEAGQCTSCVHSCL